MLRRTGLQKLISIIVQPVRLHMGPLSVSISYVICPLYFILWPYTRLISHADLVQPFLFLFWSYFCVCSGSAKATRGPQVRWRQWNERSKPASKDWQRTVCEGVTEPHVPKVTMKSQLSMVTSIFVLSQNHKLYTNCLYVASVLSVHWSIVFWFL